MEPKTIVAIVLVAFITMPSVTAKSTESSAPSGWIG